MRLANAALRNNATCRGPSVAPTPKVAMVVAMRTIRTATGSSASSRVGGRGPGRGPPSADAPVPSFPRAPSDMAGSTGQGGQSGRDRASPDLLTAVVGVTPRVDEEADQGRHEDHGDDPSPGVHHVITS